MGYCGNFAGEPAAPLPGGRPPAATPLGGRGAAGSPPLYKCFSPPPPSFASHDIQRAGGREEG